MYWVTFSEAVQGHKTFQPWRPFSTLAENRFWEKIKETRTGNWRNNMSIKDAFSMALSATQANCAQIKHSNYYHLPKQRQTG